MTESFRIRQARPDDLARLWPLARRLDSYNLPADRTFLKHLLRVSARSFHGREPMATARYLFVLERRPDGAVLGCSLIIAKHGTPGHPHLWMTVKTVRMGSRTLRCQVMHRVLQLGMTTNGPTEIGGLIVRPDYRGHPARLGRQLSYVRLAYIARHPARFQSRLLVEYLPPLRPDGTSPLWDALGSRFIPLTYRQADRLSVTNKEFIVGLFPRTPIHAALLPEAAQRQLGVVHPAAAGACGMLRAVGFRYLNQIEPFDGGPYYGAARQAISLICCARPGRLAVSPEIGPAHGLVCAEPSPGEFRAVFGPFHRSGGRVNVSRTTQRLLESPEGARVDATPLAR